MVVFRPLSIQALLAQSNLFLSHDARSWLCLWVEGLGFRVGNVLPLPSIELQRVGWRLGGGRWLNQLRLSRGRLVALLIRQHGQSLSFELLWAHAVGNVVGNFGAAGCIHVLELLLSERLLELVVVVEV